MNISCRRNNAANDCAGKQGEARKAEIYSKISMKFLGGSAYTRRTIMHARMLIDTWVERRLGPGARRERSLIMHSFQAAVIILHIAGGGVPRAQYRLPLPIFPAWQKGTAGNLVPGNMCARVYTVTLTLLLQFNAFSSGSGASRTLNIRARTTPVNNGGAQHEPKFFRIYDPRETFIFLYNGAAETRNRICKRIYRCSPLWQVYR